MQLNIFETFLCVNFGLHLIEIFWIIDHHVQSTTSHKYKNWTWVKIIIL